MGIFNIWYVFWRIFCISDFFEFNFWLGLNEKFSPVVIFFILDQSLVWSFFVFSTINSRFFFFDIFLVFLIFFFNLIFHWDKIKKFGNLSCLLYFFFFFWFKIWFGFGLDSIFLNSCSLNSFRFFPLISNFYLILDWVIFFNFNYLFTFNYNYLFN